MSTPHNLTGKVALITGGTKGIGKATALALSAAGATVVLNYSSDASAASATVSEIGEDRAFAIKGDASSVASSAEMVDEVLKKYGRLDVLVLNAGILPMVDLAGTTEEAFDRTFAVNVKGPYFLAQKAAPHMPEGSHIVFLSTSLCVSSSVTPNYLLYCSTKGAIEQMTRLVAKDLGRKGILVNAIAPGPTGTDLFFKGKPEQLLKTIASASPMNRIGTPEEIANAIAFLCSGASGWVTGQILRVNGGFA